MEGGAKLVKLEREGTGVNLSLETTSFLGGDLLNSSFPPAVRSHSPYRGLKTLYTTGVIYWRATYYNITGGPGVTYGSKDRKSVV